jgi:hypothetical protein
MSPVTDDYRRAFDTAVREYERAIADRAALDTRIAQLQHTIGTLAKLCGYEATVPLGLTDACRMVLRNATRPLTAVEVRERLRSTGFDLERYANHLASIHTVLKRMTEGGEASSSDTDETSRVAYEFLQSGIVASRTGPRTAIPSTPYAASKRQKRPRTR